MASDDANQTFFFLFVAELSKVKNFWKLAKTENISHFTVVLFWKNENVINTEYFIISSVRIYTTQKFKL